MVTSILKYILMQQGVLGTEQQLMLQVLGLGSNIGQVQSLLRVPIYLLQVEL
jgi:hypothetical protein